MHSSLSSEWTKKFETDNREIGHKTMDCTENRKLDQHRIPDKLPEEAWAILKIASDGRDLGDFRDVRIISVTVFSVEADRIAKGIKVYSKSVPMATFDEIEKKLREENFNVYLIGLVRT